MPFNPSETILDNLLARTKAEIDRLRKLLQADVKSNLNKADMAAEVVDYIRHEERAERNIAAALGSGTLDQQSYSFVYKAFKGEEKVF